jgi:hypothetical protein
MREHSGSKSGSKLWNTRAACDTAPTPWHMFDCILVHEVVTRKRFDLFERNSRNQLSFRYVPSPQLPGTRCRLTFALPSRQRWRV